VGIYYGQDARTPSKWKGGGIGVLSTVDEIVERFLRELNNPEFYRYKIRDFLTYCGRPLSDITGFDVEDFLMKSEKITSEAEAANYYAALKKFFDYTFRAKLSRDVMRLVQRPVVKKKSPRYISDSDWGKMAAYLEDKSNDLADRLLLGFFYYTGLSRKYVHELKLGNIDTQKRLLQFSGKKPISVSAKFVYLVNEFVESIEIPGPDTKLFDYEINYPSTKIKSITEMILGHPYTPTEFSNTFIKKCLEQSDDVYSISELVYESPATILKHLSGLRTNRAAVLAEQARILSAIE
jgi:hypothetical protein